VLQYSLDMKTPFFIEPKRQFISQSFVISFVLGLPNMK
jgi:hypothetical protein